MKTATIHHRYTQDELFIAEVADDDPHPIRTAVIRASKQAHRYSRYVGAGLPGAFLVCAPLGGVDLRFADLRGANLDGADLTNADARGAQLNGACLTDANLTSANLTGAWLTSANLTEAIVSEADLTGADLVYADLTGADLTGTVLTGANLSHAILDDVDLRAANLRAIREDVRAVLHTAPNEVEGLLLAVREGRIDGSTYQGDCACLVGTIANVRGCSVDDLERRSERPAERWFLAIHPGDTPEKSQLASITEEWIVEWQRDHAAGGVS